MEKKINIPFKVEEVDWRELAVIGVRKENFINNCRLQNILEQRKYINNFYQIQMPLGLMDKE